LDYHFQSIQFGLIINKQNNKEKRKIMKKSVMALIGLICAVLLVIPVSAAEDVNPWSLTLSGSGSTEIGSSKDSTINANIGLAHDINVILPGEVGVRQGVGYATKGESLTFDTEAFLNWQLRVGKVGLLAGPSIRFTYGDGQELTTTAGPEAQVRWYASEDVFVFGRANYDFQLQDRKNDDNDRLRYTLGVGFKF
jgi:hypothetical protein